MTEYRIGSRTTWAYYLISLIITAAFVGFIIWFAQGFGELMILIVIFALFLFVTYALTVMETIYDRRKKYALKGKKATAVIKKVEIQKHKNYMSYGLISYEYKDEENKECIGKTPICLDDVKYFLEGRSIPVYQNGQYAAFRIEEIKSVMATIDKEDSSKEKVKNKVSCVFCNSLYDNNLDQCPNCGAVKNKNFIDL